MPTGWTRGDVTWTADRTLEVTGLTQAQDIFEVIFLDEILKMVSIDREGERPRAEPGKSPKVSKLGESRGSSKEWVWAMVP